MSDKAACPDCGKMVTKKALKYSHKPQCRKKNLVQKVNSNDVKLEMPKPHRYAHINIL